MPFAHSFYQEHPLGSRAELWTLEFQYLSKKGGLIKTIFFRKESYFYVDGIVAICAS